MPAVRRWTSGIFAALSLVVCAIAVGLWAAGWFWHGWSYDRQAADHGFTARVSEDGVMSFDRWRAEPAGGASPPPLLRSMWGPAADSEDVERSLAGFTYWRHASFTHGTRAYHLSGPLWPLVLLAAIAPTHWLLKRRNLRPRLGLNHPAVGRVILLIVLAGGFVLLVASQSAPVLLIAVPLVALVVGAEALGLSRRAWREGRRNRGLCARCGYDLRACKSRCPECGEAVVLRPSRRAGG